MGTGPVNRLRLEALDTRDEAAHLLADHDPRPEGVGILRAVSAAAKALGDVMPLARSLVRIGASSAARASARSDWALLPGLMRASCFTSVPHAVHQAAP